MAQSAQAFSNPIQDDDIRISPAAREKMIDLMRDAEGEYSHIRIFVSGGGCGGMGYGMTFAEGTTDYDHVLDTEGLSVAVDAIALNYLRGAEIDFSGNSFVFNNVFKSVGGSGRCGGCGGGCGF